MESSQFEVSRPRTTKNTPGNRRPVTQSFAEIDPLVLLNPINPDKMNGSSSGASTLSGIFNVVNTIIGGGALALPFVIKESGVIGGSILIIVVGLLTLYSQRLIVKTCYYNGGVFSYAELGERAFGMSYGRILAEVPVILFTWGAQVGYIIIVGNLATPMLHMLGLEFFNFKITSAILAAIVMFPLSALRNMDSLRYTSLLALFFIGCLVIGVVVKTSKRMYQWGILDQSISLFGSGFSGFFVSLPIVNFAFTFHSSLPPVWKELKDPSPDNINFISALSVFICGVIYFLLGIFGYLYMLDRTKDNILVAFPDDVLFIGIKIGYTLVILFSYPLLNYATRNGVDNIIFKSKQPAPWWRIVIESLIIVILSYVLAILVPSIDIVFGIIGSTVGQLVIFVNPALFYIILYDDIDPLSLAIEGEGTEISLKDNEPDRKAGNWRRYFTCQKIPASLLIFFGILFGVMSVVEIGLNISELNDN